MKQSPINTWQGVYVEVLRRLNTRLYKPGELLPHEADLAAELGCARATVNRALRAIAEEGLLERRRRGGTRVVVNPERKATLVIPIIRLQVEQLNHAYGYHMLNRRMAKPPKPVREAMSVPAGEKLLFIRAMHSANTRPYVLENRWINLSVVAAAAVDFSKQSPNEWLVDNVPVTSGSIALSAASADTEEASLLRCDAGDAVLAEERVTRNENSKTNTWVRLLYAPDYRLELAM